MDAPNSVAFGTLLRRHRIAAGLTQEELAERAGVSARSIGDMERGVIHTPRKDTVTRLAAALALSPADRAALVEAARRLGASAVPAPSPGGMSAPPFVGRARELDLLERHLAGEEPPLLLLAGEPGIGKTRLLHAAIPRAAARGLRALEGGCHRRGGQEPYAPILGALQRHVRNQRPAHLRAELQGCAWLVRLLPELAAGPIPPLPAWHLTPPHEQRLMRDAVVRFLANVAGPAGTLLVLDDLQWAGQDALDLLATLVRAAGDVPLRLLGAYRDTEVQAQDPLAVLLADLAHAGLAARRLLGPLTPPEAAQLWDGLVADEADEAGALRERVLQRAGGVPFFVVSCARARRWAGPEEGEAVAVPWDIAQSVRQRVAALPARARELLDVAAVAGREVRPPLLAAVAGQAEQDALVALDAASHARLLVDAGADTYQFAHDVIREVVEADLGAARQTVLHRWVAEALEQQQEPLPVELLAYHYTRGGVREKAIAYLEQAGDRAQARYAAAAAAGYYRELVACLEEMGRARDAAHAREKLGTALDMMARYDEALEVLERAAATFQALGDRDALARALARIGRAHAGRDTPDAGLARIQPLLSTLGEGDPSPGMAALYAALTWLFLAANRYAESVAAATQAADMARALGNERILADAEVRRGRALTELGHLEEGRRAAEGALPLVEAVGDLSTLGRLCNNLGDIYKLQGAFDQSRRYRERALTLNEQIGELIGIRWALAGLGELLFLRGEWEAARVYLEQAVEVTRATGWSLLAGIPLVDLAELHAARGEWELAARYLDGFEDDPKVGPRAQRLLAERDLLEGRSAAARGRLTRFLDGVGWEKRYLSDLLPLLAWAHLELGDMAQASDLVARAVAYARAETHRLGLVEALWVQALVASAQEEWAEAERAVVEGLALARSLPYPYAEGRHLHVSGSMHRQKGELELARQRLAEARTLFRRLGACRDVERVGLAVARLQQPQ